MIYFFVFLLGLTFTVVGGTGRNINVLSGFSLMLFLCVMAGIRSNTGTDFATYADIWSAASPLFDPSGSVLTGFYEPLFLVTNSTLKQLTSDQTVFFFFYATVTLVVLHLGLRKLSLNLSYAYLLYFCIFYLPYLFNAMRQAVAMSFFIYAIPAILKQRTAKVVLIGVVAGGFHFSGLLIILGYFFGKATKSLALSPWVVFLIVTLLGGIMAVTGTVGQIFFAFFPGSLVFQEVFDTSSSSVNLVTRLGLCVLVVSFSKMIRGDKRDIEFLINIYLLGLFIYLSLYQFNMLATRFNMLFRVLEVVIVPLIATRLRADWKAVFSMIILAFSLIALLVIGNQPDYIYNYTLPF